MVSVMRTLVNNDSISYDTYPSSNGSGIVHGQVLKSIVCCR